MHLVEVVGYIHKLRLKEKWMEVTQKSKILHYKFMLLTSIQKDTLVEPKVSDKISRHKADLYFLMHNDPCFHVGVGYVPKINSGSTHNIKISTVSL